MAPTVLLLLCLAVAPAFSQISLSKYNIDPNSVTVSGISSGACMSTQYHVAHSNEVLGVALFAGVIYHCANGLSSGALLCMSSPGVINVNQFIGDTDNFESNGSIDPTSGISGDKVFIFAGTEDTVVKPGNGNKIEEYYNHYNADVFTQYNIAAEHCQPTDFYGPSCSTLGGEYINDCTYNGAYEALNYMYSNSLTRPSQSIPLNGQFSAFDQSEFFSNPSGSSVDTTGYVYIPSGCVDKSTTCKLHVAFHGCDQSKSVLGDSFAKNTGYLQVGEQNNVIILFPQTISKALSNPQGCWDWWGYTGAFNYATKNADQISGIYSMVQRLING